MPSTASRTKVSYCDLGDFDMRLYSEIPFRCATPRIEADLANDPQTRTPGRIPADCNQAQAREFGMQRPLQQWPLFREPLFHSL
jgi:hypothetical protein